MSKKTKLPKLVLTPEQRIKLETISNARAASLRDVQRAKVLLLYADGKPITHIQKQAGLSRPSIYKCIEKALAAGPEAGLKDYYHRPFDPVIDDAAKAWVVNLACTKPKDYGFAAELWTYQELARYTREHAPKEGHHCLANAAKATIWRILNEHDIKPHKIKYYLEKRDPDFEQKMNDVLVVYQEVNMQNDQGDIAVPSKTITVSVDEKPGVQALETIAPDLSPAPGRHQCTGRDYEYKRHGTVSILAGLDLHTGEIIAQVHDRHRSREFIELLKEIDSRYPKENTIRLVLDNHSSHISKETMKYLASLPNRFEYVHTPKHGSWLNLIESAFSKMARTFLRHIRVSSKEELKERILKGIAEMNSAPVIFRWKKFDLECS
ncbi:conserved hypothetical protein [Desulfonatronospira thiodismutans ASO3-1]|uniref:Uncharacterized protein n=1 Tax=Desulfonatronospira thiodismutans ASO3-1 TaxID=555779 RepID=D6SK54_9BACT|nr:IS630 family transposase [Desulfonatronospira thiodismutans]EFI34412.1 conserved hypothetical protein [Desulfonatronospira thiodismutans ASO3-1]EFI36257.1 conserved hypothetical protein [Desulfonatronospira thiodismutans ASO3-1]